MNTQVCLLGGEVMPNVLGALSQQPQRLVPVITRDSERQLEALGGALSASGSPVLLAAPVTVLPYDLADCLATLRRVLDGLSNRPCVNWTGGTKVMSYAARRLAEERRLPAIYINTAERQLLFEDLATGLARSEALDSQQLGVNVLAHIRAAGHSVENGGSLQAFRERCTPTPELERAAELILDARPAERNELLKLTEAALRPHTPSRLPESFLDALRAARLIQRAAQPGAFYLSHETALHPFFLQTPQEQNAQFLKSTYLEVFLWSQLKHRGAFDDVAWHVVLNPGHKGRLTELDVAVAGDSRLLVLECKSHLDLKDLPDVIEEQFARTRRIGRLFGRWALYVHRFRADYQGNNAPDIIAGHEARARDYGGKLLWHDDLSELPVTMGRLLNETTPIV
jgi:hypothetical protein